MIVEFIESLGPNNDEVKIKETIENYTKNGYKLKEFKYIDYSRDNEYYTNRFILIFDK